MRLWRQRGSNNLAYTRFVALGDSERLKILHLFRALLRQCSYLPDPASRKFLHKHVVSRFRDYHPSNVYSPSNGNGKTIELMQQRRPMLIKTARKGVKYLQRANDGHQLHLGKVLSLTYGRIGTRRHALLKSLKIPDIPVDQEAVERLNDPREQNVPQPSKQLMALIRSQAKRRVLYFDRPSHPAIAPNIPEKNNWGRPMPVKRVRNMKRRWYALALDKIMPPLPEKDWHELRKLATGETPWEGPVPRRGQDKKRVFKDDLMRYPGLLSSPHVLTPRYMRRMWARIFGQCPLMTPNEKSRTGWHVKWGDMREDMKLVLPSKNHGTNPLALFEGVDEHGKVVREGDAYHGFSEPEPEPSRAMV